MEFATPLVSGCFLRRYKRFFVDVRLDDGTEVTAHCPNPGSMLGLNEVGTKVWLEPNSDPRKKLKYGWRLIEQVDGHFVGIDTSIPNRILKGALMAHQVPGLPPYTHARPEVKYGQNSRIDFLLTGDGPDTYVEVKSVTTHRAAGVAEFPDCVTERGAKHLAELADVAAAGHNAIMFYLVQRTDAEVATIARDLDPAYGAAFDLAAQAGVTALAQRCDITPKAITLGPPLPFRP